MHKPRIQSHNPPKLQHVELKGHPITVLRWDLNHSTISGNKAEKLAWHLQAIATLNSKTPVILLSMGGPWSNHLHALGAACHRGTHQASVLIRGETPNQPSPTLKDVAAWGIDCHFLSRSAYRSLRTLSNDYFQSSTTCNPSQNSSPNDFTNINDDPFKIIDTLPGFQSITHSMPDTESAYLRKTLAFTMLKSYHFSEQLRVHIADLPLAKNRLHWWIPEGGNNAFGIWSIAAWAKNTLEYLDGQNTTGDTWILPVGSSCTLKGIIAGFHFANSSKKPKVIGVPVFKNSHYLDTEITKFTTRWACNNISWTLWHDAIQGKFGKLSPELIQARATLEESLNTPLDPVYTLKVAHALAGKLNEPHSIDMTSRQCSQLGHVCFLHTGGLQGNRH